jgi:hypothetical protein
MDNFYNGCPPKMGDSRFLTDYRTSNTREEYIKAINGITREHDYRDFLQKKGSEIMDKEWGYLKSKKSCTSKRCVHSYPTRVSPGQNHEEMTKYNDIQSKKILPGDPKYPSCGKLNDYRMTHTGDVKY